MGVIAGSEHPRKTWSSQLIINKSRKICSWHLKLLYLVYALHSLARRSANTYLIKYKRHQS